MIQKLKTIFLLLILIAPFTSFGQPVRMKYKDRVGDSTVIVNTAIKPQKVKRKPALKSELSGGLRLNSDGYSIFIDKGFLRGGDEFGSENRDRFFQVRVIELEFSEIKHSKEMSSNPIIAGNSFPAGSYTLGKINNFYQLKLGVGNRKLIAGKPDPETISIHWVYMGGFSAGLLKPYYLQIYGLGEVKYSDEIEYSFISPELISGKASFSKGLNEIQFLPGIFLKTGMHFDFASRKNWVSGLEVGVNGSIYTQKVQQMVAQKPEQYFLNLYISLQFGKKW